jgi:hypothetical protein
MSQKHPFFLMAGLAALLLAAVSWGLLIYKVGFNPDQYDLFSKICLQTLRAVLVAVFFLLVLIARAFPVGSKPPRTHVGLWSAGLAVTLLSAGAISAVVNPHARLPWLHYSSIGLATRLIKTKDYKKLTQPPDIIILGSSRAFTIAPFYVRQLTGMSVFNASVEGGRPADFVVQTTMFDARAFVIEVIPPLDAGNDVLTTFAPLNWIPFIPLDLKFAAADDILADLLSSQSLVDSIFLLRMSRTGFALPFWWTFNPDGEGVTPGSGLDRGLLEQEITNQREVSQCTQLDRGGMADLRQILVSAQQRGVAVIAYLSPRQQDFYEQVMQNNAGYQFCHAVFVAFMESLQDEYPNFHFQDYSHLETVWALAGDGFYDSHHLTVVGAQALMDALSPAIVEAIGQMHTPAVRSDP